MKMLALDLEASLIDNAMQGNPRPGLNAFLTFCLEQFDRLALLTTVDEAAAREVLHSLADRGSAPEEFAANAEYIHWHGEYKDLRFARDANPDEILFVDDDRGWVHPDQVEQWIPIKPWHGGEDAELARTQQLIVARIS